MVKWFYIEPKKNYAKGNFNNYDQRPYDGLDGKMSIDKLEKKLFGNMMSLKKIA